MRKSPIAKLGAVAGIATFGIALSASALAQEWYPFPVEVWDPPFDMAYITATHLLEHHEDIPDTGHFNTSSALFALVPEPGQKFLTDKPFFFY